jgi:signal transduction histidine kinase
VADALRARFDRGDGKRGRPAGGSGPGLATVRQMARAHGGDIEIASTKGVGTRATIILPGFVALSDGRELPSGSSVPSPAR